MEFNNDDDDWFDVSVKCTCCGTLVTIRQLCPLPPANFLCDKPTCLRTIQCMYCNCHFATKNPSPIPLLCDNCASHARYVRHRVSDSRAEIHDDLALHIVAHASHNGPVTAGCPLHFHPGSTTYNQQFKVESYEPLIKVVPDEFAVVGRRVRSDEKFFQVFYAFCQGHGYNPYEPGDNNYLWSYRDSIPEYCRCRLSFFYEEITVVPKSKASAAAQRHPYMTLGFRRITCETTDQ